jgi:hypothetical protein
MRPDLGARSREERYCATDDDGASWKVQDEYSRPLIGKSYETLEEGARRASLQPDAQRTFFGDVTLACKSRN